MVFLIFFVSAPILSPLIITSPLVGAIKEVIIFIDGEVVGIVMSDRECNDSPGPDVIIKTCFEKSILSSVYFLPFCSGLQQIGCSFRRHHRYLGISGVLWADTADK